MKFTISKPKGKTAHVALLALTTSALSIIPVQSSQAHNAIGSSNIVASQGTLDGSLLVATKTSTTAVAHTGIVASGEVDARSYGLFYKDTTSASAQTATVLTGGLLSIYAQVSTTTAISVDTNNGRVYGGVSQGGQITSSSGATGVAFTFTTAQFAAGATAIAVIVQAPSTAGSFTISMSKRGATTATIPTETDLLAGTEIGVITVTVLGSTNLSTSHPNTGSSANLAVVSGPVNNSLLVATASNTGGVAVEPTTGAIESTAITANARSTGLLAKDSSMATAQTATVLAGGKLSLYANVSTTTALTSSGGTFASTTSGGGAVTYSDPTSSTLISLSHAQSALGATGIGTLWTAPTTAGTYTVSMYYASNTSVPTLPAAASGPASGVLGAQITVTVVAASAGGSYSAAKSNCVTKTVVTASALTSVDNTSAGAIPSGDVWYVGFLLNDAYGADLGAGSLVASATNGGIVSISATDGAAVSAGSASTAVLAGTGSAAIVRIDQPTAGAPLTTTVTISYNGTTVCTKTVSIAGVAATVTVSDVATVDLNGSTADVDWLDEGSVLTTGNRKGHYRVILKDSAGNNVLPASSSEFSIDPATVNTTVTTLSVLSAIATSTSSSSLGRFSVGTFTCGAAAGSSQTKIRHTSSVTGVTITSPAFTARCADDPYTFTASFDKAKYTQGEVATLTVKFLDSKGNAANSLDTPGAVSMVVPFLTAISATGSASMLPDTNGVKTYTFTVGTTGGMTAGTYTSIIDFPSLVNATKSTPTYTLATGGDTTTNADVLKSIVALIASINKQIQALQKLILKR